MRILFICTGNICRSPTAEAVFRRKAADQGLAAETDSAGISSEESGNPPHPRSTEVAESRGFPMPRTTARRVRADDFRTFDLLIAMDRRHVRALETLAPSGLEDRIRLLMDYVESPPTLDVPDPWYGPDEGFVDVFEMIERGVDGVIAALIREGAAAKGSPSSNPNGNWA